MKKIVLVAVMAIGTTFLMSFTDSNSMKEVKEVKEMIVQSDFDKGFEDGHCEGWKDVKGEYSICPISPIPPIPKIGQSSDSYRDGYNTGFKAGMRAARNN
jgi:hypothetical protein